MKLLNDTLGVCLIALNFAPLVLALVWRRWAKATIYLAVLLLVWLVALDLMSGHMNVVPALVLIAYPAAWIFLLAVAHQRSRQVEAMVQGSEADAP